MGRIGVFGMVGGSDGGRGSGYSATELGAKGGASGVGYVPRGKSKEGDEQVLGIIYRGGYEVDVPRRKEVVHRRITVAVAP
ncbi:hypothetical protein Hamer_G019057 [Homarus americanus]|uniref:Uncharacterized protein n=1 Tax=Homarus americanus TaxID=6706 RepID=A0A8J5K034_HOMAM|nr:hypothetical protein Hamer_G019057 [Homarus americanus]